MVVRRRTELALIARTDVTRNSSQPGAKGEAISESQATDLPWAWQWQAAAVNQDSVDI